MTTASIEYVISAELYDPAKTLYPKMCLGSMKMCAGQLTDPQVNAHLHRKNYNTTPCKPMVRLRTLSSLLLHWSAVEKLTRSDLAFKSCRR